MDSQQHPVEHHHQQQDRPHLRRQRASFEDEDEPAQHEAVGGRAVPNSKDTSNGTQHEQQQETHDQQLQHKRKRSKHGTRQRHLLLSFEGEEDEAPATQERAASAKRMPGTAESSSSGRQPQASGISQATAAKFRAEARMAAAARFTFKPSGSTAPSLAGLSPTAHQQQQHPGLVDEDASLRPDTPAGLSQIHFGMAQARGARPYQEDRHCIITALKPSQTAAVAATAVNDTLPAALNGAPLAQAAANGSDGVVGLQDPQQRPALHDGVARSYAAIFDGHNGAGAAETAARQLHLHLAGHPALRIFKGDHGPPAVVKQEEVAVGKALKAAFRQVDDLVLGVARRDGTRDGATALVVLRLGGALYAAHAGDSRAVLCRAGQAHRLTEDHKPNLPQERQRIEDAGGRVDFQRCWRVVVEPRDGRPGSGLAVSRSLGDLDFKEPARFVECEPDVLRLALLPHKDTFVVLGSDGLWDVLSDTDAVLTAAAALRAYATEHHHSSSHQQASAAAVTAATQLYRQHGPTLPQHRPQCIEQHSAELPGDLLFSDGAATAAAEALLAESMRRGTMDNVTVIVMLLQWG